MAEKIIVPTLGESVTEATVSKWLKTQGENVSVDEPIVELETDKVNVEVPSPSNGVLDNIAVQEGETVNVGSLLGTIVGSSIKTQNNIKELKNYSPPEKKIETEEKPKIFICGHSHILKVEFDKVNNVLFINPGAAGRHGFHKKRTMIRFEINEEKIENMETFENLAFDI